MVKKRNQGRSRRRSAGARILRWTLLAAGSIVAASILAVTALRFIDPPFTAVMLFEPGPVRAIDYRPVRRAAIGEAAALAVIAAEDQRFLDHRGIDFIALSQAWTDYRRGDTLRGASTITQQVAKNIFLWNGRSFLRKGLEAWFATLIDLLWSKQRILEVYLNIAEFGPGVFGVEAAAREYFGRGAAGLSVEQAALLAAVLPSPKRMQAGSPSDYVRMRAGEIAYQMRLLGERGHYRGLDW